MAETKPRPLIAIQYLPVASILYPMIAWDNINTVFLDLDGTVLDLGFDNYFWQEFVPLRYAQDKVLALETAKPLVLSLSP